MPRDRHGFRSVNGRLLPSGLDPRCSLDSPMLIVCPNCATSYQVEPSSLGATGRSVRCVRCKKVWFASNTESMAAIAASHHQDIAAFSTAGAGMSEPPVDDAPAESAMDQAAAEDRDDRGPAPLPEPVDYQLPPEEPPAVVEDAPPLAPGRPGDPTATRGRKYPRGHRIGGRAPASAAAATRQVALADARMGHRDPPADHHQYRPGRLARRYRSPAAANGFDLCRDRLRRESARPCFHRAGHAQGDPGRRPDADWSKASSRAIRGKRRTCRGSALPCGTRKGSRSTPGRRCRRATRSRPAPPCRSARVSPRHRPTRRRCWCDFSTGAISSPEYNEVSDGTHFSRRGRRRPP